MFLKRAEQCEIMDDFSIQDERIDYALKELRIINYFLGGNAGSKQAIMKVIADSKNKKILLLDVGSGSSDILDDLKKSYRNIQVISVDKNKRVCGFIQKNSNIKPLIVCADAFALPFKQNSVDIVHTSLFLHHFNFSQIQRLLNIFKQTAKSSLVINDLQRSIRAYFGIKLLTLLFSRSELVKNDAPISVRKGFSKKEMTSLLDSEKFSNYEISRKWAFRWLITIHF